MPVSSSESQANINSLLAKGYTQAQISAYNYGPKLNPTEMNTFLTANPTPGGSTTTSTTPALPSLQQLGSTQFQFDPSIYLPGIQQQAATIYDPQQAQIQALQGLQQSKTEQTRVKTNQDFDARMKSEIESINSRGAFFSGGAINTQGQINRERTQSLTDVNLQSQADAAQLLAQSGAISAEQAKYITDQLQNSQSSAYNQFQDQRNFTLSLLQQQTQESQFAQNMAFDKARFAEEMGIKQSAAKADLAAAEAKANAAVGDASWEQNYKQSQLDWQKAYQTALLQIQQQNADTAEQKANNSGSNW